MVIIIGILLCLVPGIAVIYPLWRKFSSMSPPPEDESSLEADLIGGGSQRLMVFIPLSSNIR